MTNTSKRLEDKIQHLCAHVAAGNANTEMLVELQKALREHIENLRERYSIFPLNGERRRRSE